MSYCVQCGVGLHGGAKSCALCQTPVVNPNKPTNSELPPPFPSKREAVQPVSKTELAILMTVMLGCVAVLCTFLNLFLHPDGALWSLYVIGAGVMLWVWVVLPLAKPRMSLTLKVCLDLGAIILYLYLIAQDLNGMDWFLAIALPISLTAMAQMLLVVEWMKDGRSILTSATILIGTVGVFLILMELYLDRYLHGAYRPGWSCAVAAVCVALIIPLVVVRHRPTLRDEVRRRFHV